MSKPIKKLRLGKVESSVWEGDYQGKPTYSVSFQKSYKDKQGNWKNTNFFTLPDLRDLYSLVGYMIDKQVKEVTNNKPKEVIKGVEIDENISSDPFFTEN